MSPKKLVYCRRARCDDWSIPVMRKARVFGKRPKHGPRFVESDGAVIASLAKMSCGDPRYCDWGSLGAVTTSEPQNACRCWCLLLYCLSCSRRVRVRLKNVQSYDDTAVKRLLTGAVLRNALACTFAEFVLFSSRPLLPSLTPPHLRTIPYSSQRPDVHRPFILSPSTNPLYIYFSLLTETTTPPPPRVGKHSCTA